MKTSIYTLVSIAAMPFVLFSCMKERQFDLPAPENLVTIQGTIVEQEPSKVVAADAPTGIDWNWETGDQIAVISGESTSVFDIRSGFGPKEASFIGKEIKGETYTIQYPGSLTAAGMESVSVLGQIQNGLAEDAKKHLKYYAQLSGQADYKTFNFATDDPALKQSGVLKFSLVLPAEAVVVNTVSLKAETPIFHSGNASDALTDELSVSIIDGALGADKAVTAWMTTSWFNDEIAAGSKLSVNVSAGDFNWVADITPTVNKTLKSGFVNTVKVEDAAAWVTGNRYLDGDGTQENPWQIKTAKQLTYVRDDMVSKEMRYFKLVADVDMAGIEWLPLNNVADPSDDTKSFDKFVSFDGGGHTIYNLTVGEVSYPSFAGVLYGTVKDVTFTDAKIDGGENKSGVVAGYMGSSQNFTAAVISGVTVKNASVSATRHVGVLVGQVATGDNTITDCHVIGGTVTGAQYAGGFAGYIQNAVVTGSSSSATVSGTKNVGGFVGKTDTPTITGCWYDGPSVSCSASGNNQSGGFAGTLGKSGTEAGTVTGCYVKGSALNLSVGQRIGGFAGQVEAYNKVTKCYVENVTLSGGQNTGGFVGVDYTGSAGEGAGIYQCHVDGGSVTATAANCGGFVGYPEGATIRNCYTSMDVNGVTFAAIGGFVGLCKAKTTNIQYCYSSGNISGTNATKGAFAGNVDGDTTTHINSCIAWNDSMAFAGKVKTGCDVSGNYIGKEGTISYQASILGWDPEIWDFSAKLK